MPVKLRSQQITMDLPRTGAEPWIHIVIQRCEMDDNHKELNVVDRWGTINKRLSDVATQVFPCNGMPGLPPGHISVYGTSLAIGAIAIAWIIEKYGGYLNEHGEIIVEE